MQKCLALKYTLILLLTALVSFSQVPYSGIYVVRKPLRRSPCQQELKMLIGEKKICMLKKPIISIDQLEYVTDILYDPVVKSHYIKLGLSAESIKVLNQTNNA
jgi:hypothetical protein